MNEKEWTDEELEELFRKDFRNNGNFFRSLQGLVESGYFPKESALKILAMRNELTKESEAEILSSAKKREEKTIDDILDLYNSGKINKSEMKKRMKTKGDKK